MKLLVLAQVPPPAHGQSLAVAALLAHLAQDPGFDVHHVNLPLSRDAADVGRWRMGKVLTSVRAGLRARRWLARHGARPIYYVPAPGKRGALYRDWVILGLCRPRSSGLILHWHAVGLGEWLDRQATSLERTLTHRALGGATLAIAQAEMGRADAEKLRPQRCVVVRNGVSDPAPGFAAKPAFGRPCEVVFVGLGCREKGLFDALGGIVLANRKEPGAFHLTAMGPFAGADEEKAFRRLASTTEGAVDHVGFVPEARKNELLAKADLFCFPSYYPHEGQPAVLLEALAHDLPVVATRWRGIPENLPDRHVHLVDPRSPDQVARALRRARDEGPPGGALRAHFLSHFTRERHLAALTQAIASVGDSG